MPRSNSSFGVADGGSVVSAPVALVLRGGGGGKAPAASWSRPRRYSQDRADTLRRARRARQPALRQGSGAGRRQARAAHRGRSGSGWDRRHRHGAGPVPGASRSFLDDRRRSSDLRLIAGLGRGLPIGWIRLHRRRGGDIGLGNRRRSAGSTLGAALKQSQALFELPVTILQFLVLAGELPQLILKLLNPDFRIDIVGLGESRRTQDRRTQHQHRGDSRGARNLMKSE